MKLSFALMTLALTSSLFAQTYDDNPERDKRIESLITTHAASKCADGSAKVFLDGGYLSVKIDRPYIAKTDQQVFVVITPRPEGNKVGIYYCPVRNIYMENGKQKSVNVPLDYFQYNLGQLRKSETCDFSDILSGTINLTFRGSRPVTLALRPVMGNEKEKAEYKKLCSDKNKQTTKVQDVICLPEDSKTEPGKLTEQVSESLKKKFSCDPRDLISGQMRVGAGTSVYVDEINKKAEIATQVVYPGAKEKIDRVLNLQEGTSRYELSADNRKSSFEIVGQGAGILTETITYNGKTTTEVLSCKTP